MADQGESHVALQEVPAFSWHQLDPSSHPIQGHELRRRGPLHQARLLAMLWSRLQQQIERLVQVAAQPLKLGGVLEVPLLQQFAVVFHQTKRRQFLHVVIEVVPIDFQLGFDLNRAHFINVRKRKVNRSACGVGEGCRDWVCSYSGHVLTIREEPALWFEDAAWGLTQDDKRVASIEKAFLVSLHKETKMFRSNLIAPSVPARRAPLRITRITDAS